jgi:hypothetical protein
MVLDADLSDEAGAALAELVDDSFFSSHDCFVVCKPETRKRP